MNDVERIAPCLPGAQLQEIDGDEFKGVVKIKVGPITAQYKGQAVFIERDEAAGRVVIKADGRDTRGAGNANALITATLHEVSDTVTRVDVHTDLSITGKVAQFGRGVIADVSNKLMGQFSDNLRDLVASDSTIGLADSPAQAPDVGTGSEGPRSIDSPEVEAVDLLDAAGAPMFKRALPVVGGIAALLIARRMVKSRRA